MYLCHVVDSRVHDDYWRDVSAVCDRDKELRSKANRLRRQVADLEREAISRGLLDGPAAVASPTLD